LAIAERVATDCVMPNQERIRDYRCRAEELRTIAEDCLSSEAQSLLKELARDYERMAERLEGSRAMHRLSNSMSP